MKDKGLVDGNNDPKGWVDAIIAHHDRKGEPFEPTHLLTDLQSYLSLVQDSDSP